MSPTSAGGGTNTKTGGEHISRLVAKRSCLWQNWNNGVITPSDGAFASLVTGNDAQSAKPGRPHNTCPEFQNATD